MHKSDLKWSAMMRNNVLVLHVICVQASPWAIESPASWPSSKFLPLSVERPVWPAGSWRALPKNILWLTPQDDGNGAISNIHRWN